MRLNYRALLSRPILACTCSETIKRIEKLHNTLVCFYFRNGSTNNNNNNNKVFIIRHENERTVELGKSARSNTFLDNGVSLLPDSIALL